MSIAIPVSGSIVPDAIETIDGVVWFLIYNDGTYEAYKALEKVYRMDGKFFVKMGWNSDTKTVSFRETPETLIATL